MLRTIDSKLLLLVQNWVADPLQWAWIKLDWQQRGAICLLILGIIGYTYVDLNNLSYFQLTLDGIIFIISLHQVVYGIPKSRILEAKRSLFGVLYAGFLLIGMSIVLFERTNLRDICFIFFSAGSFLGHYLLRCTPKPPSGNLKFASDRV